MYSFAELVGDWDKRRYLKALRNEHVPYQTAAGLNGVSRKVQGGGIAQLINRCNSRHAN
jgi:hypothetical protein